MAHTNGSPNCQSVFRESVAQILVDFAVEHSHNGMTAECVVQVIEFVQKMVVEPVFVGFLTNPLDYFFDVRVVESKLYPKQYANLILLHNS